MLLGIFSDIFRTEKIKSEMSSKTEISKRVYLAKMIFSHHTETL